MSGKSSRNKGAVFERTVRNYLADVLSEDVVNPAASGFSGADAVVRGFAIECKNHQTLKLPEWWDQAVGQVQNDELPVLVHKRRGRTAEGDQWITMDLFTFVQILRRISEATESVGDMDGGTQ